MGNLLRRYAIWVAIALVGAVCWAVLAFSRGETVSAGWLLFAALASYAIAYRFYARFIKTRFWRRTTRGLRQRSGSTMGGTSSRWTGGCYSGITSRR